MDQTPITGQTRARPSVSDNSGTADDSIADPTSRALSIVAPAGLAACGGGGGATTQSLTALPGGGQTEGQNIAPVAAAKFLNQASMGGGQADIESVQRDGFEGWIDMQFASPRTIPSLFGWLRDQDFENDPNEIGSSASAVFDAAIWRSFIISNDTLRQRVAYALSQILVVGFAGVSGAGFRSFAMAAYMDILLDHGFSNYRQILEQVSRSPVMGNYLTFSGNRKSTNGSLPDENYAREIMQLFSIGLYALNLDGSLKLDSGQPIETYDTADIMGLARVFTGWGPDVSKSPNMSFTFPNGNTRTVRSNAEFWRLPMVQNAALYETGAKTFLGQTIPAGTPADAALVQALDILFNHPNVGPFIGKQLIQRLVKSNPSPGYVGRVARAFNTGSCGNFGSGQRGDMRAVISAILLDSEARGAATHATGNKLREPVLRLTQWARAFKLSSPDDKWRLGNLSAKSNGLGQVAMRSPSVFNFYRPGYVPPSTRLAKNGLLAPEFQITDDVSVAGYVNYIQTVIPNGIRTPGSSTYSKADYSDLIPLADTPDKLAAQVNLTLAGGALPAAKEVLIANAIAKIPAAAQAGKMRRIHAAVMLVMASSEFLVLT